MPPPGLLAWQAVRMTRLVRIGLFVLAGVVVVGAGVYATDMDLTDLRHFGKPRNVLQIEGQQIRIPLPEGPPSRELPSVPVSTTGNYAFMFEEQGQGPTRYDPCRPLEWVLNTHGMPEGAQSLIDEAVADVSRTSGLSFEYVGHTQEIAAFDRPLFQDRYGEDFVPIIVGWSDAEETTQLAGSVTGLGGSSSVNGAYGDQRYLAAGVVILDIDDVTELMTTPHGTALATAVIKHEMAHVIGLAHVDDDTELMNHENGTLTEWGPGDLAGLAIAGNGPCQ